MTERALVVLTHVASQILHRWLPLPVRPATDADGHLAFGARWPSPAVVEAALSAGERDGGAGDWAAWRGTLEPAAEPPDAATDLSGTDWHGLLAADLSASRPRLPWLRPFQERYDRDGRRLAAAARGHVAAVHRAGGRVLTCVDPDYPQSLLALADPPVGLTVIGEVALLSGLCTSVVGSRKASALAIHESFALGRGLAEAGRTVVSGGAFGCDIAAHHGALAWREAAVVPAVCVFAGGLAQLYPRGNAAVFRRLAARRAALVSERLWAMPCRPVDFHVRNRLIAGLSALTVVMQAAQRSGALVTARLALDAGREVAVLRHPEGDVRAAGGAALLAEGAPGVSSAAELLASLPRPSQKVR